MTESASGIESATEKTLLIGTLQECPEDTGNIPEAKRKTKNAPGKGKGTEITEISEIRESTEISETSEISEIRETSEISETRGISEIREIRESRGIREAVTANMTDEVW